MRCGIERIEGLKDELVAAKRSFESLAGEEREQVSRYQADRRLRQLTSYLERYHVRNVKISGIGPAKEAALRSYGIESAADVDQRKVLAVPGFGSINSRPLLEWRQELERKFVYDPQPNAVDQAARDQLRPDSQTLIMLSSSAAAAFQHAKNWCFSWFRPSDNHALTE